MPYWKQLFTNNTGKSSKTFALVYFAIVGGIAIICFPVMLFIDLFNPNLKIESDLYGIAAVITAIATLIGVVFLGKVKGEKSERNYYDHSNNEEEVG